MQSIKSVYKIGNGPSSSHTVGPYRAAAKFGERYPDADAFRVTLYGSLAFTGEGHGTGGAVMAALGILESMLGFNQNMLTLMIALYIAQDSFGTACNVTGDGAIAMLMNAITGKKEAEKEQAAA